MCIKILLPHEVAAQLRCSRRQVYDLFRDGELSGFRLGTHIKIHADSVNDFIKRNSNTQPPPVNQRGLRSPPLMPPTLPPPRPPSRPRRQEPGVLRHLTD